MKISIIGSGNVASHLGKAISKANIAIVNVWSRNFSNAVSLANEIEAKSTNNIQEILSDASDLIIIAVKDEAISEVVEQLKGTNKCLVHVSGSTPINVFNSFGSYGVIYPLQTFSKASELDFSSVPLCLEANNKETLILLKTLSAKLSKSIFEVDSTQRKTLHLSAVFACNFPNFLFGIAQQLLAENELNFDIIRPLIKETANKVQTFLPQNVQTGPAIRNDVQTLQAHENMLIAHQEYLKIYQQLSKQIQNTN